HLFRPDLDVARLASSMVVARHVAEIAAREDDVGIVGSDGDVAAFAAADLPALGIGDGSKLRAAGHRDGGVVLLRAVQPVGRPRVGGDVIQLGGGLVIDRRPRRTRVVGDHCTAVVAFDHALAVGRVDPQIVVIAVWDRERGERLAAVVGLPGLYVQYPYGFRIARVGEDVVVVPGTLPQVS